MLFHGARLSARMDDHGGAVLLEDQDRASWDRSLIGVANTWLSRSRDVHPTRFHLEAAIAQQHCLAPSVSETNWPLIVQLYERLLSLRPGPIYTLNRAIAKGQAGDCDDALADIGKLRRDGQLSDYSLLDCAAARLHELRGDEARARECYESALRCTLAAHERILIEQKLKALGKIRSLISYAHDFL
ncbi:MAG: putative RNA polymerase sigma factor [Pseudohongiellaceae bacterium]|jgi:predicted RNA polymerase sigma factor